MKVSSSVSLEYASFSRDTGKSSIASGMDNHGLSPLWEMVIEFEALELFPGATGLRKFAKPAGLCIAGSGKLFLQPRVVRCRAISSSSFSRDSKLPDGKHGQVSCVVSPRSTQPHHALPHWALTRFPRQAARLTLVKMNFLRPSSASGAVEELSINQVLPAEEQIRASKINTTRIKF